MRAGAEVVVEGGPCTVVRMVNLEFEEPDVPTGMREKKERDGYVVACRVCETTRCQEIGYG